jgi:flagellar biosynthesis anti-sigma factor FlgM
MRIDLNTVSLGLTTQKLEKSPRKSGSSQSDNAASNEVREDQVKLNSLVEQALHAPETRQDKVDSLRQAVQSGQYSVDPHEIAGAILANAGK